MASIKLYFDKRVNRKDGKFPLKINVTHKRQQALINLGVLLSPDQWDSTKGKVINGPNKSFLNGYISQRVHCAETELLNLRIAGKLDLMTGKQFKEHLQRILLRGKLEEKQEETGCSFVQYYTRFVEGKKNPQTKAVYQYTLDRICRFVDVPDKFRFEDVTYAWLKSFEIHLSETSKVNSISIHMRNIRAVFNDALNTETISCYPFRRFKIKQEATAKRALTPEELVTLRDYPCEEHQKQYVDIFMLIFYLVGKSLRAYVFLAVEEIDGVGVYLPCHPVGKPVYLRLEQPDDPGFCNYLAVIPHTGTQSAHHLHQVVIRPLLLGKRVQITGGEDTPYLPDIRFFKIHPRGLNQIRLHRFASLLFQNSCDHALSPAVPWHPNPLKVPVLAVLAPLRPRPSMLPGA